MGAAELHLSDRVRLKHLIRSTKQHLVLDRLVKTHGWTRGAEIGVLRGKTLFYLLDNNPALIMYGVDQWQHLPLRPDENAETYVDFDMGLLAREVVLEAARYRGDRCRILCGDSVLMSDHVDAGSLDFVFIDGDHTAAGIARDIGAWAPKVRAGGTVLGHDCHWSTVRGVIDALCPGWIDYGEAVWGRSRGGVLA